MFRKIIQENTSSCACFYTDRDRQCVKHTLYHRVIKYSYILINVMFSTEELPFLTDQVRVVMDATAADDWIQVDAIRLVGRTLPTGQYIMVDAIKLTWTTLQKFVY